MGKRRRGKRRAKPRVMKDFPVATAKPPVPEPSPAGGKRRPFFLIVLAAGVIAVSGYILLRRGRDVSVVRDPEVNVLLITLDTTRADRLGCYGYEPARTPTLDDLARKGVLFANAYCPVPLTLPSHASILTGLNPFSHGVHNNGTYALGEEQRTLAEILRERGMATAAFTASFSVDSRFGLGQGFDVYDDSFQGDIPFKPVNSERRADDVFASFSAWLEKNAPARFFAWVHFFDPHLPYAPPPDLAQDFLDRPYDGEIAAMDRAIGRIVEALREKNILDRTLIILAGDHGEALGEKGESGHGVFLYEMSVRVPLIFYAGERLPAGTTVDPRVRLIDIVPTVLDLLAVNPPGDLEGESLIPYIEKRATKPLDSYLETFYPRENHGWAELTGLVSGEWKYIEAPRPELYHLGRDPEETSNLVAEEKETAAGMKRALEDMIRGAAGGPKAGRSLTAEDEERLRSLGYIQFAGKGTGGGPDPKDKIEEMKLYQEAQRFEFEGNFRAAEELSERLLALSPDIPSSYVNLALAQARLQKFEAAVETLKTGVERIPGSEILLSRLGHTYLVTNRTADALETMQKVLEIDPDNVDALTACAVILGNWGQRDSARAYLERALAVEPENKYLRVNLAGNLAMSGRTPEAIALFEELVADYPGEAIFLQNLGIAYGMTGDFAKAIVSLEEAVRIQPTPAAYYNLAVAYREKGELEKAVRVLELYLENPGEAPEANVRRARAELERIRAELK
jgi:choline-sulfatase